MSISSLITYDSTGFTFDSEKISIPVSGPATLKDQRPTNSTFYASYTSGIDGNWGGGVLTGTAVGGAAVSGGKLDLTGGTLKYVNYDADLNADSQQVGCIRFKVIPNYSGTLTTTQLFFTASQIAGSLNNLIGVYHTNVGDLRMAVYNSAGTVLFDQATAWSPVSGVEYEMEFNWDITTGASRLFLNGVQIGATNASTGTRSSAIGLFRIGTSYTAAFTANFKIDDVIVFSTVQHTANYTPNAYGSETIYATDDPTITVNASVVADALEGFSEVASKSGSDEVKYNVIFAGVDKYWTGSTWATSNGTYSQANTAAEIQTNRAALNLTAGGTFKIKAFLHSATGSTTPTLVSNTLVYNYFGALPTALTICTIWGYIQDVYGNFISGVQVTAEQAQTGTPVRNFQISPFSAQATTSNSSGYWEINLIRSNQFSPAMKYTFSLKHPDGQVVFYRSLTVPNQDSQEFNSLV